MLTKSELAHQELRQVVLSGRPGQHIGEVEWSERLNLKRFAIRQALRQLHGEGLVSKTKGKYRIPTLDVRDAREIAHLRAVLEAGTLLLMHHAMAPEDLQKIRQAAIDFDELFRKQYFNGAREADLRFHQAIVASSRNPRLIKFYEASNLPLIEAPAGPPTAESTNFAPAVQEHREILAALERGDNGEAARLLERHLEHAEARRGKLADSGDGARSQAPRP